MILFFNAITIPPIKAASLGTNYFQKWSRNYAYTYTQHALMLQTAQTGIGEKPQTRDARIRMRVQGRDWVFHIFSSKKSFRNQLT